MIAAHCFQTDWIQDRRTLLGGGDPVLIEKTIHAFALLAALALEDLPFVFKGGTSLLLRLERLKRLSIDIDIMCSLPDHELIPVLERVSCQAPFIHFEEDERGPNRLPKRRHFRFHYASVIDPRQQAAFVLLDVVQEEAPHPGIDSVPLRTLFIELEQDLLVRIPTCAGLLGDKLTAFAPNTVGIPCSEFSAMQVMKQLFDVAELFQIVDDTEGVKRAYDALFEKENGYRGSRYSREQALQDSIETARRICRLRLRGATPDPQSILLDQGRRALESHLFGARFSEAEMKIAAAKAAFLATMVLHQSTGGPMGSLRYSADKVSSLRSIELSDGVLQRLRDGVPEAFYYWSLVEQMQGRDDEA